MTNLSDKQQAIIDALVADIRQMDGVAAIVLGGSFASGTANENSDIDIGLYYHEDKPFSIEALQRIAQKHNADADVTLTDFGGWGRWVNGGGWLTIQGQRVDLLYRNLERVAKIITDCENGKIELDYYQQPATGFYSYIYLAETHICKILYSSDDTLQQLKERVATYPPKLKAKIIREFKWQAEFALDHAMKALLRNDTHTFLACLSRIVSCIVQLIYAINETYFISDKGAVEACTQFKIVPEYFSERVDTIFFQPDKESINYCLGFLRAIAPYMQ